MDDDEIDRFIKQLGLELPDVEDDDQDDEAPPSLDDLGEDDRERKPRDWRQEWEREWGEEDD